MVLIAIAVLATNIVFLVVDALIGTPSQTARGIAGLLCAIALNLPAIILYAKRWHDRDKSGWWSLIVLIPGIGGIWMLIELGFLRGTAGPNRFGSDPNG